MNRGVCEHIDSIMLCRRYPSRANIDEFTRVISAPGVRTEATAKSLKINKSRLIPIVSLHPSANYGGGIAIGLRYGVATTESTMRGG